MKMKNLKTLTRITLENHLPHFLNKHIKGKVLEIGPQEKNYFDKLKITAHETLDIDETHKGLTYVDDIHQTKLPSKSYDSIVAIQVFEHLYNPFLAAKQIHRLLKKGGYFVGTTCFIYPYHGEPQDYFRFTRFGLESVFSDFSEVKIYTVGNRLYSLTDLITTSNRFLKLLRIFHRTVPKKFHPNSKVPLGFIIVAKK